MLGNIHPSFPHLLIVDADVAIRNALTFALELSGFVVDSYPSAEALLQEQTLPADACLIIDYELPGINGLQLLRSLRMRRVESAAILITTNPTRKLRAEAQAAGIPIVEKPLLTEDLERTLHRVFEGSSNQSHIAEASII